MTSTSTALPRLWLPNHLHFPLRRSPTAVEYTGTIDPALFGDGSRAQMASAAAHYPQIIGFSYPDQRFYSMVDPIALFVPDTINTLYLKTAGAAGDRSRYVAPSNFMNCNDTVTCSKSRVTDENSFPARNDLDSLLVTQIKADTLKVMVESEFFPTPVCEMGDKLPGCIPSKVLDGAYFLWRFKTNDPNGGNQFNYAKIVLNYGKAGCFSGNYMTITPNRQDATPICFKHQQLKISSKADGELDMSLTFNGNPFVQQNSLSTLWNRISTVAASGTPINNRTTVYAYWLGGKLAFASDHEGDNCDGNGQGNCSLPFYSTPDGFSLFHMPAVDIPPNYYRSGCGGTDLVMIGGNGFAKTDGGNGPIGLMDYYLLGGPMTQFYDFTDQNWEMIVPSDYWQIRDFIVNGFGQYTCCSATAFDTAVTSKCKLLGFDPTSNAASCQSLLLGRCVGPMLDTDECLQFCRDTGACDDAWAKYCGLIQEPGVTLNQTDAFNKPNCGCFMPQAFMDKYYESLFAKLPEAFKTGLVQEPICSYPQCQAALIHRKREPNATPCQSLQICYQNSVVNVNDQGSIIGGVSQLQDNECSIITDQSVPPTGTRSVNGVGTRTGTQTSSPQGTSSTAIRTQTIVVIVIVVVFAAFVFGYFLFRRPKKPVVAKVT